ncbi:MAG: M48 family metallopeptidase [Bacteroidales bacterium]
MKKIVYFGVLAILFSACSSVPLTGRKQILLVSEQEVLSLSSQSFTDYMKTAVPSTNKTNTALVVKVGKKMAAVVEAYLKSNGMEAEVANFAWEFHLVKDSTANAFCMPGGKIVVNEGILPITKNETGLAVVLGHEIAHAIAKHSNERMSQQMLAQYGGAVLGAAMSGSTQQKQQMAQTVYGLGAQFGVMLPFSRKQESEADKMGLIFLAMAQYDPNEAIKFWERMSEMSGGQKPLEFMSTHPSDETRIANIKKSIPEAQKYLKK